MPDDEKGGAVMGDVDDGEEELIPIGAVLEGHQQAVARVRDEVYATEKKRSREPPHVGRAEHDVLAAVVAHGADALEICEDVGLRGADFYDEKSGLIYDAAVAVHARGAIVSVISICDQLHRKAKLEPLGGTYGVEEAIWQAENAADKVEDVTGWLEDGLVDGGLKTLRTHAELVLELAQRRRIIEVCRHAIVSAYTGADSGRVLDEAQLALSKIEVGVGSVVADNASIVNGLLKTLPAFGGVRPVLKTGFADLDRQLHGGFAPGDLIVLAGRPSMGKTEFVIGLLSRISVDRGEAAMLFSLEMDAEQLLTRIAGGRARANVMRKEASRAQVNRLVTAFGEVAVAPIAIDDTPALDITRLRAKARAYHRRHRLSFIAVDYLQLLVGGEETDTNRTEAVGEMTRGLKALARELKVPVIALSQLNRGVEQRSDKRPMMSDLRESGNIEQDADVIGFFYREEYYAKEKCPEDKRGIAELNIAKHRNGPTGVVRLRFGRHENDPADAPPRFDSLAREDDDV